MLKNLILIVVFLSSFSTYSQINGLPKKPKAGESYVRCLNGDGSWVKVFNNPSAKKIKNIQNKLSYLKYAIVKTMVYDKQTKYVLKQFNKEQGLQPYPGIIEHTLSKLNKAYKKKQKQAKRK